MTEAPHRDIAAATSAAAMPVYTCPACSAVSHNPHDIAFRWCARCFRFADSAPVLHVTLPRTHPDYPIGAVDHPTALAWLTSDARTVDLGAHGSGGLADYLGEYRTLTGTLCDEGPRTCNPYWALVRAARCFNHYRDGMSYMLGCRWEVWETMPFHPLRQSLVQAYGWSIPSPSDLAWIQDLLDGRGVLDLGAGGGYWSWQFAQLGINSLALDNGSWPRPARPWHLIADGDDTDAATHPDRALFLSWPPGGDPFAARAVSAYRGDLLIVAADGPQCGDDEFDDILDRRWRPIGDAPGHATFAGVRDRLTAYRRRT